MDSLALLDRARAAGLRITVDGPLLRIRGPRNAEPIVRDLMANKSAVMAALAAESRRSQTCGDTGDGDTTHKFPKRQEVLSPSPLSPASDGPETLPPEWRFLWEERAAIMEFDGGLPRQLAEARALAAIREAMCCQLTRGDGDTTPLFPERQRVLSPSPLSPAIEAMAPTWGG